MSIEELEAAALKLEPKARARLAERVVSHKSAQQQGNVSAAFADVIVSADSSTITLARPDDARERRIEASAQ